MKAPPGTPSGARRRMHLAWGVHARLALGSSTRRSAEEPGRAVVAARHDSIDGKLPQCRQAEAGLHHYEHVLELARGPLQHLLDRGWGGHRMPDGSLLQSCYARKKRRDTTNLSESESPSPAAAQS